MSHELIGRIKAAVGAGTPAGGAGISAHSPGWVRAPWTITANAVRASVSGSVGWPNASWSMHSRVPSGRSAHR